MINWFGSNPADTNIVLMFSSDTFYQEGPAIPSATNTTARLTAATNGYALVSVIHYHGLGMSVLTNMAFGGTNCTFLGRATDSVGVQVELWGLAIGGMAAGTNLTVANFDSFVLAPTDVAMHTSIFHRVNQATPTGGFAAANGSVASVTDPISVTVVSAAGQRIVDVVSNYGNRQIIPATTGQSVVWEAPPSPSVEVRGSGSMINGAALVTMTWTNMEPFRTWAQGAIPLKP